MEEVDDGEAIRDDVVLAEVEGMLLGTQPQEGRFPQLAAGPQGERRLAEAALETIDCRSIRFIPVQRLTSQTILIAIKTAVGPFLGMNLSVLDGSVLLSKAGSQ